MVLLSGVMSVILGGIFMGIRWKYWDSKWKQKPIFEQDNINDRLGFFHALMAVGIWPMLLTMVSQTWREKRSVTRDVEDGLYSKFAYIITKVLKIVDLIFRSWRNWAVQSSDHDFSL